MNKLTIPGLAAVISMLCAGELMAHHSRSNFELETIIEIEGVVTEYSWRNPHSYVRMDVVNEEGETVNWLVELQSTPMLTRLGWAEDSLKPGDQITAVGNPDRDRSKPFLYLDDIIAEDGVLWGEIPDAGFTASTDVRKESVPRTENLQRIMAGTAEANAVQVSGDFVGTWIPNYGGAMNLHIEDAFFTAERNARTTPEGDAMLAAYSDDDDPSYSCVSYSIPYLSTMPFATRISRQETGGEENLLFEYSWMEQKRTIHLGMSEHPADIEPSLLGHSIGWIEEDGAVLKIDTIGFTEATWGTARGVHQSEQKRVVEEYRLEDGGARIEYKSYTLDPLYLSEPLVRFLQYQNERGREFILYDCDTESATRHLELENR
jgi:hypothetical protein